MRGLVRICKDARDVLVYLDVGLKHGRVVDLVEVLDQIGSIMGEAIATGIVMDGDRKAVAERLLSVSQVDAEFLDQIERELISTVMMRVDGCTTGYSMTDVVIVNRMAWHLGSLVLKAGIVEAFVNLLLCNPSRRQINLRSSIEVVLDSWVRRQRRIERLGGDPVTYLEEQKAILARARKEIRWARERIGQSDDAVLV